MSDEATVTITITIPAAALAALIDLRNQLTNDVSLAVWDYHGEADEVDSGQAIWALGHLPENT